MPADAPENEDSVAPFLVGLRAGDAAAVNELTRRYFGRVVRAAARRLPNGRPLRGTGPEDVAASVFESLWARAAVGGFSEKELSDGDELWRLLCKMTASKAVDHARRERAAKRGGGRIRGESVFLGLSGRDSDVAEGLDGTAGACFAPDELAAFAESHDRLMRALPDDRLREIAVLRLEGYEVKEIAEKFGLSDRSIKRKLALIRDDWSNAFRHGA